MNETCVRGRDWSGERCSRFASMVLIGGWTTVQFQHDRVFEWVNHVAKLNQSSRLSQCEAKMKNLTPMMATTVPKMAPLNTSVAWCRLSVIRVIPETVRERESSIGEDRRSMCEIYQYRPPTRNRAFAWHMGISQYYGNSKLCECKARRDMPSLARASEHDGQLTARKIKPQNADEACPDGNDWLKWKEDRMKMSDVIASEMRNSSHRRQVSV